MWSRQQRHRMRRPFFAGWACGGPQVEALGHRDGAGDGETRTSSRRLPGIKSSLDGRIQAVGYLLEPEQRIRLWEVPSFEEIAAAETGALQSLVDPPAAR